MGSNKVQHYPMRELRNVGVQLLDCEHRTPKPAPSGFPYVAIPNIQDGRLVLSDVRLISQEDYESWTRRTKPQAQDIILTRRGRVGDTAFVPAGLKCAIGQNLVILRSSGEQIDQRYLRWALRGPLYQEQVRKYLNVGAIFDSLNCADIPKFEIPVPPMPIQRSIARILSSLDDKIELNQRLNMTLQAVAQAVFKSWFVDFDPVQAKINKSLPAGIDDKTAALFPASFEDSSIGKVPKGWSVSSIGAELQTVLGGTPSRSESSYWSNGTIPWINSGKVNEFRIIEPSEYITEDGLKNSVTRPLPERTTVVAITGATVGQVSLLEISSCTNQSVVGILGSNDIPSEFIYFWVKYYIDDLIAWQTGGAQQHINKNNVNDLTILCPSAEVISAYLKIVRPLFDMIKQRSFESRMLTAMRDTLLPKLLSGQVRVKIPETISDKGTT